MAGLSLKHAFVSGLPDNATSTQVQPSNWNAEHALTLDQFNLVGRQSAGNGPAEELPTSAPVISFLASVSQLAMRAALGQMLTADIGLLQVTGAQIANATITAAQLAGINAQSMTVSALGKSTVNHGLKATVSGGNLTINLVTAAGNTPSITDPVQIVFRDAASGAANGNPVLRTVNAATSLVIPSGANLGVGTSATPFRGWLVALDNSGTVVLGVVVCTTLTTSAGVSVTTLSGMSSESTPIGATAVSNTSATPGVVYASTGVSGKAFRVIGSFEYSAGLASAGVYSIAPTGLNIQGPGDKGPGDVVQRVYQVSTVQGTLSSGSLAPVVSGPTQAFTPTSLVNPVRVWAQGTLSVSGTTAAIQIANGATLIGAAPQQFSTSTYAVVSVIAYDQPNTLSQVTYQIYGKGTIDYPATGFAASFEITEIMA